MNPNQTSLEIHYTGLSLIKSNQIKFRYKLEGLEENWIEAGMNRTANYSYLPAGNYTFRVIAANANGVWNTDGASVKIVVHPYFYQRWWFLALAAIAVALIVWLIYHNRVSQLRKFAAAKSEFSRRLIESQEAERKRIAAELHDGLGQSLAIISNRAAMGKNKNNEPEYVFREFDEISKDALEALDEVQEITAKLHPRYLERLGLTKALKTMFVKVADVLEFDYEIDVIDGVFPKDAEINVYRIVQESVNNIIKHSDAAEAEIKIKKFADKVVITIKDDGRGFDTNNIKPSGGGLGLVGIKERTNIIGGTISINSSIGIGTEIRINLPINLIPSAKADGNS
jgi:signal transduction histidine kinase